MDFGIQETIGVSTGIYLVDSFVLLPYSRCSIGAWVLVLLGYHQLPLTWLNQGHSSLGRVTASVSVLPG